jgi:signal transduction histidine kinase
MAAIDRLKRAYGAVCACNSAIVRALSEEQLLNAVCHTLVVAGGYRMAWVGYAEANTSRDISVRAMAGADDGYLQKATVRWSGDDPHGAGPTGVAIRTGLSCVNRDSRDNSAYGPWSEDALLHGFASSIGMPLQVDGKTIGALSVYADHPDAFDVEETRLLVRCAEDLSFAIGSFKARAALEQRDEQLRQAGRMGLIGQLTTGVIHDLNNLLLVIHMCGTELLETRPRGDVRDELVTDLVGASGKAIAITKQLLSVGRKGVRRPRVQPIWPIVEGLRSLIECAMGKGVAVEVTATAGVGDVEIDVGHLEQVLLNLCINARSAMPEGGRLCVTVGEAGDIPSSAIPAGRVLGRAAEVSVRDTGTGIPLDVLGRIFEPFFTTKPAGSGTGVGLSVVLGIVDHYGGQIAVESAVGEGTTFRVFLPLAGG